MVTRQFNATVEWMSTLFERRAVIDARSALKEARARGFTYNILFRARKRLKVASVKIKGRWVWVHVKERKQ